MTWWSELSDEQKEKCRKCLWLKTKPSNRNEYICSAPDDSTMEERDCCECGGACAHFPEVPCPVDEGVEASEVGKIIEEYEDIRKDFIDKLEEECDSDE